MHLRYLVCRTRFPVDELTLNAARLSGLHRLACRSTPQLERLPGDGRHGREANRHQPLASSERPRVEDLRQYRQVQSEGLERYCQRARAECVPVPHYRPP